MNILLFVGAGASVEAGIPAMRQMVEEFQDHLKMTALDAQTRTRFEQQLTDSDYDMENLIAYVESLESGQTSQQKLGYEADQDLLKNSRMMRWEAEWFVQHVCQRFRHLDADALWRGTLRHVDKHRLCVATSNYDTLLEVACKINDVPYDDGFDAFDNGEAARWRGIRAMELGKITLLKVHGSTDWYKGRNGNVYKLRHSMPLYGDLMISLDDKNSVTTNLASSLILPTKEKLSSEPPYPDLNTQFRNISANSEIVIFIGTSLRDPDIRDICRQCADRVPTYLVTTLVTEEMRNIPRLNTITGTASGFLASTLPKFLASDQGESVSFLNKCAEGTVGTVGNYSILQSLVTALLGSDDTDEVCSAIERLVDCGASLGPADIQSLLYHESLAVRKYGLALIPKAIDVSESLRIATERKNMEVDSSFAEELELLIRLM